MRATDPTPADNANQTQAAEACGAAFRCDVWTMPRYAVWDWVLARDGVVVAVAEYKRRKVEASVYPTIYLAMPKWRALAWAANHLDCAALFVVGFDDGIRWVSCPDEVAGAEIAVGGRHDRPGVRTDIEELVHIPVSAMHAL